MKLLPALVVGLVSGGVSSAVSVELARSSSAAPGPAAAAPSADLDLLEERLAALDRRQEELGAELRELRLRAPSSPRLPVGEIEAAVDRALADRGGAGAGTPATAAALPAVGGPELELDFDTALARLVEDDFESHLARESFWQEVRDAGLLDEVVAEFEARAEADPGNPAAQVDLGEVYLQKIFEVGQGPLAGVFASRADQAFDAALEIDETHWQARFTKATALSFWPPVFGKQAEAIHQYEILVEQQEGSAPRGEYAQTYLLLGNLYQQTGKPEKALEAWRRGLQVFPDDQALIDQIEVSSD